MTALLWARRYPLEVAMLGLVFIFSLHNLIQYDPLFGYDGGSHLSMIYSLAKNWRMPETGYASSNPPLYYFIGAALYRLSHSEKIVQCFSWLLYLTEIFLLRAALMRFVSKRWLVHVLLLFFAVLPLSIEFGLMVMNYPLGHFLSILSLYLFLRILTEPDPKPLLIWLLIATVVSGIFASLTGLAAWATAFPVLYVYMPRPKRQRQFYAGALLFLSLISLGSFALQRKQKYGCVLCTTHRKENVFTLFDPKVYFRVSGLASPAWTKPFYPNAFAVSLPMILFETFYSDYFNYLTPKYLKRNTENRKDWSFTGASYVDPKRIAQFRAQIYLGVPLFLFFVYALFKRGAVGRGSEPDSKVKKTYWLFAFLTIFQFLVYIHRYQDFVNWHSGYLYPLAFLGCLLVGRQLDRSLPQVRFVVPLLVAYSLLNLWVFWL